MGSSMKINVGTVKTHLLQLTKYISKLKDIESEKIKRELIDSHWLL